MRRRNSARRRDVDDLGDQLLAAVVARVGLAGEDELHRPVLVVEDARPGARGCGRQRAALVGGEAAGEADGQRLGVEHLVGRGRSRRAARRGRSSCFLQPAPGEGDQPLAAALVRPPQLGVGDVVDALPDAVVGRVAPPTACRGSGRRAAPSPAQTSVRCGRRW